MKKVILNIYYKFLKINHLITSRYNYVLSIFIKPPTVKTTDETLDKMVNEKYSVSRYGDGEFSLMSGESLLFQPYSEKLRERLEEIIKSKQERHIVCIPNVFESVDWCTEKPKKYWTKYLNLKRSKIYRLLDLEKEYWDALVTRLYIDHKDKSRAKERFSKIKNLWKDRDIVIVEGEKSRLGVGNDLFRNARSIKRIVCPPKDAFSNYSDIFNVVKTHDTSNLILIALGPTATVLAYDLSLCGYQAVDIGHIDIEYEWFLQKVEEKCPVKNKYIGEIEGGTHVEEMTDERYKSEIVYKIG
jgi:glycosyltransferase family protein